MLIDETGSKGVSPHRSQTAVELVNIWPVTSPELRPDPPASDDRKQEVLPGSVMSNRNCGLCCSVVFLGFDFCEFPMRKSKPKENTA